MERIWKWLITDGGVSRAVVAIVLLLVVATGVVPMERVVACLVGGQVPLASSSRSLELQGLVSPSAP